jgi:inorganic pyrophosphatase
VITPVPLIPGVVVRCRPLGMLKMTDEAGPDAKVLAVPVDKVCGLYSHFKDYNDVSAWRLTMICHFFEHYKDLDKGKWVKVDGWAGIEDARQEILNGVDRYNNAEDKPAF